MSTVVHKYAGPPGTGKTTTLLNKLDEILASGVQPEDIVFTTFTRAGAYEARDRAMNRFNLPVSRLPYFKTLHALCYSMLPTRGVMQPSDWCALARRLGVSFSIRFSEDEGIPRGQTKGDYMMSLWALSRVSCKPIREVFDRRKEFMRGHDDVTMQELEHFIETVADYKFSTGKIDYTDMLELWLKDGMTPGATHVIVDEAQDFSQLQWNCVKKLARGSRFLLIAGDDDQAIHEWNGAKPDLFINHPADRYTVLNQSFRIPSSVHSLAESVAGKIKHRLPKEYRPRDEEGSVNRATSVDEVPFEEPGTWLILARNQRFLDGIASKLVRRGIWFKTPLGVPSPINPAIPAAIKIWKLLQSGKSIHAKEAEILYRFLSSGDRVRRGFKKTLETAKSHVSLKDLQDHHGLLALKDTPWSTALDMIKPEELAYLQLIERSGQLDMGAPRVELSTIHGSKGREADHVALITDMAHPTWESYIKNPDAEHRVWYVGVTRARKDLWIVRPQTNKAYEL